MTQDEKVELVARAMVEPLGYFGKTLEDAEHIWVGNNIDDAETGSLAYLCRSLAAAALSTIPVEEPTLLRDSQRGQYPLGPGAARKEPTTGDAEPSAYLKFWFDGDSPRCRVDMTEICEPWLDALKPTITPLYTLRAALAQSQPTPDKDGATWAGYDAAEAEAHDPED